MDKDHIFYHMRYGSDWRGIEYCGGFTDDPETTSLCIGDLYVEDRSVFIDFEEKMAKCEDNIKRIIKNGIELGIESFSKKLETDRTYSFEVDDYLMCRVCDHKESEEIANTLTSQADWYKYHGYSPYIELKNVQYPRSFGGSPGDAGCYYAIFSKNEDVTEFAGYFGLQKERYHVELANIEYYLLPKYRGKNIIYKVLFSFFRRGQMSLTGVKGIQGKARIDNLPSNTILKKLGFEYLGVQKYAAGNESGYPSDFNLYYLGLKEGC